MKLQVFLEKLYKALDNPSCYLQGGFGQRLLNPGGDWYDKNYSWNKTNAAVIAAHTNTNPVSFGFDCVCLIKGCLWGFNAAPAKAYGGAKYESNKVPDFTIRKLYEAYCYDISEDFSPDPEPGEILFYDREFSHVGVSIGGGYVIEATPAWKCGVQRTLIANRLNPGILTPCRSGNGGRTVRRLLLIMRTNSRLLRTGRPCIKCFPKNTESLKLKIHSFALNWNK